MESNAKRFVIDRYNERVRQHGFSPRSLGWPKGRQEVRFTVLSEIGIARGDSVLDLGCGFGDFARYLRHRRIDVSYLGCDINKEIIELGKEHDSSIALEVRDIEENPFPQGSFDWVVATGIFESLSHEDEQSQMRWVKEMLQQMVRTCKKGIAVDFLSSYVDFRDEGNFHPRPTDVINAARTCSKRVLLRHDYMPFEFCIYLYKDDRVNDRNVFSAFDSQLDESLKREFAVQ